MRSDRKIATKDLVDGLVESIRRELTRNSELCNESTTYTGGRFAFRVTVNLYSRSPRPKTPDMTGEGTIGEPEQGDDVRQVVATGEYTRESK